MVVKLPGRRDGEVMAQNGKRDRVASLPLPVPRPAAATTPGEPVRFVSAFQGPGRYPFEGDIPHATIDLILAQSRPLLARSVAPSGRPQDRGRRPVSRIRHLDPVSHGPAGRAGRASFSPPTQASGSSRWRARCERRDGPRRASALAGAQPVHAAAPSESLPSSRRASPVIRAAASERGHGPGVSRRRSPAAFSTAVRVKSIGT